MAVFTIHSPIASNISALKIPEIKTRGGRSPPARGWRIPVQVRSDNLQISSNSGFECDHFSEMRHRFLNFKDHTYKNNLELFESLAKAQKPKFMVISCADSRVCPSIILGFNPGEAFVVRNIANLVPPFEHGPSETSAALEYAVKSLKVEHILVMGHRSCGGIKALMSMEDSTKPSFITNWVSLGKKARFNTESSGSDLSFEQQCRSCEKECVKESMKNTMTYRWIKERVKRDMLYVHGGYYDMVHCTFELWSLNHGNDGHNSEMCYSFTDSLLWS